MISSTLGSNLFELKCCKHTAHKNEKKKKKTPQRVDEGESKRGNYIREVKRKKLNTLKDLDV